MNWNKWIRQVHRWLSIIFTTVVIAIFVTLGIGKQPAEWVYFVPLLPLALLMQLAVLAEQLAIARTRTRPGVIHCNSSVVPSAT